MSRSPECSEGEGSPHPSSQTLPPVILSAAKDLARTYEESPGVQGPFHDKCCISGYNDHRNTHSFPEELISEGATHLGPVLEPVAADRLTLNAALAELLKYSLARRDTTTRTFSIHRLVQAVIKDELDEQTQRQWAARAVRAVKQVFPFEEAPPWLRSQRYLPHALVCEELIKNWDITLDEASTLLNNAGVYLRARGQYQEAAPLYQYALSIQEKMYGRDHPNTDPLLNNLAILYRNQGKFEEARSLYQRSLAICEKRYGPDHHETAATLNNLAVLYWNQGKYTEAEPLYLRALAIYEKVFGPDHPSTTRTRKNYTELLQKMGQKTQVVDQEG